MNKNNKSHTYTVHIEPAEEGGFVAVVPAFGDAATQGETFDETLEMAADLIRGYLEIYHEEGRPIPKEHHPFSATLVSVALTDVQRVWPDFQPSKQNR